MIIIKNKKIFLNYKVKYTVVKNFIKLYNEKNSNIKIIKIKNLIIDELIKKIEIEKRFIIKYKKQIEKKEKIKKEIEKFTENEILELYNDVKEFIFDIINEKDLKKMKEIEKFFRDWKETTDPDIVYYNYIFILKKYNFNLEEIKKMEYKELKNYIKIILLLNKK